MRFLESPLLVILRHAEPRRSELDPALTSLGHRTALEAGAWVADQLKQEGVVRVLHTPTARTRQTTEAVVHWLGDRAQVDTIDVLPETIQDLHILVDRTAGAHPDLPPRPHPPLVLVGHHTTLVGLARELDLKPFHLEPRNYTAGIVLVRDATAHRGWRVLAHRPGRPPG